MEVSTQAPDGPFWESVLPRELWLEILRFLGAKELFFLRLTSQQMKYFIHNLIVP